MKAESLNQQRKKIGVFEKYLTLWVSLCIAAGIAIGHFAGDSIGFLSELEIYRVNIPVAVLIWLMIYPMMLQVDFSSIKNVGKRPKGLILTLTVNRLASILPGLSCSARLRVQPWFSSGVT